jgi:uncharacterized protein (TIGR02270 family)
MTVRVEPLAHLVEESFEEAGFLWSRWESDLSSISRNIDEVWSWTEDRLSGALDGALLASDAMLEPWVRRSIESGRRQELSSLAYVLSTSAAPSARALLARTLADAKGTRLNALIRGLEVAPLDGTFAPVTKVLARQSPEHAAALSGLKAFRRAALGDELKVGYESADPACQVLALHAARQLPLQYAAAWVDAGLKSEHAAVRAAAMQTGIRHQIPNAWHEAIIAVRERNSEYARLLPVLAMLGHETEHQLIFSLLGEPKLQRRAIWSLGCIGTQEAAHYCIVALKHPKLARMAAEAYCAITGVDLVRERMSLPEPDEPSPAFEDDDLDANLVPSAEDQWPLPNPDALKEHWQRQHQRLQPGIRYARGEAVEPMTLMRAIETAPMLRRPSYLFELYVRSSGKYDAEPRTTRSIQRQMMAAGRMRLAELAVH